MEKKAKKKEMITVLQLYRAKRIIISGNYMENILKGSHPKMTGQNDWQDESLTGQKRYSTALHV